MTANFTKRQLIKALEDERDTQISLRNYSNNEKIKKAKKDYFINNYGDKIKELVLASKRALDMEDKLVRAINNDTSLSTYGARKQGIIYKSTDKDNLLNYFMNEFIYFREGSEVSCYTRELNNEVTQIRDEWNKLIEIVKSLSKKEAIAFLEEKNIEIPTLEEQVKETTALVNYDINTSLLFTEKVEQNQE